MSTACCQRGGTESPTYDFYSAAALLAMQSAVKRCLYAESNVVRFIAQYSVFYGGMASIERNVLTYSRHYQLPASQLFIERPVYSQQY